VPSQVLTEGARMLRFLTPTEPWRERVAGKVSLPGEWPVMLIEIFHTEDGKISMTCVLGVLKSSLKAFLASGRVPIRIPRASGRDRRDPRCPFQAGRKGPRDQDGLNCADVQAETHPG
jgi:hypothetical protein